MTFEYFDHKADIGIIGKGTNLQEAFEEAAKAMFNVMVDIEMVGPIKTIEIECSAENKEELLIEWLNKLLAEATINEMVFSQFMVNIKDNSLTGAAKGEHLDPEKHKIKTEVKAATYSQLKVEEKDGLFVVRCVVDV